jgi:hypothetical protein
MRNGLNGVGLVSGAHNVSPDALANLAHMDAVLDVNPGDASSRICPVMVRMDPESSCFKLDVTLFVCGTDDTMTCESIQGSNAGRFVFVGNPGAKTLAALQAVQNHEDRRVAFVVPLPDTGSPVRIMWSGLDDYQLNRGPEWGEDQGISLVKATRRGRRAKKATTPDPAPQTAPEAPQESTEAPEAPGEEG